MAPLRRYAAACATALWPLSVANALTVTGPSCFDETHEEYNLIASVFRGAGSIFVGNEEISPTHKKHCERVMAGDDLHFVVQAGEEEAAAAIAGIQSLEIRAEEADGSPMAVRVRSWVSENRSWEVSMAPRSAGNASISFWFAGEQAAPSTSVLVVPGTINATHATMEGPTSGVAGERLTFSVRTYDTFGNPRTHNDLRSMSFSIAGLNNTPAVFSQIPLIMRVAQTNEYRVSITPDAAEDLRIRVHFRPPPSKFLQKSGGEGTVVLERTVHITAKEL